VVVLKYRHCTKCGCRIDWRKIRCCRHQVERELCGVLRLDLEEVRSSGE